MAIGTTSGWYALARARRRAGVRRASPPPLERYSVVYSVYVSGPGLADDHEGVDVHLGPPRRGVLGASHFDGDLVLDTRRQTGGLPDHLSGLRRLGVQVDRLDRAVVDLDRGDAHGRTERRDPGRVTAHGVSDVLEQRVGALGGRGVDAAVVRARERHRLPATRVADAARAVEERPDDGVVNRQHRERLADRAEGAADAAVGAGARADLERVLVQADAARGQPAQLQVERRGRAGRRCDRRVRRRSAPGDQVGAGADALLHLVVMHVGAGRPGELHRDGPVGQVGIGRQRGRGGEALLRRRAWHTRGNARLHGVVGRLCAREARQRLEVGAQAGIQAAQQTPHPRLGVRQAAILVDEVPDDRALATQAARREDVHLLAARRAHHVQPHRVALVALQDGRLGIAVRGRAEGVGVVRPRAGIPALGRLVVDQGRAADVPRVGHVAGTDVRIGVHQHQAEVAVALAVRGVDVDLGADVPGVAGDRVGERGARRSDHHGTVQAIAGHVGADGADPQRGRAAEAGDRGAPDLVRVGEVAVHARLAAADTLLVGVASIDAGGLRLADELADVEGDVGQTAVAVVGQGDLDALAGGDVQRQRLRHELARLDGGGLRRGHEGVLAAHGSIRDLDRADGELVHRRAGRARVAGISRGRWPATGLRAERRRRAGRRGLAGERLGGGHAPLEHPDQTPGTVAELLAQTVVVQVVACLLLQAAGAALEEQRDALGDASLIRILLRGDIRPGADRLGNAGLGIRDLPGLAGHARL